MADIRCAFTNLAVQHIRNWQKEVLMTWEHRVTARARLLCCRPAGGGGIKIITKSQ